jgi:hypothetical protein
MTAALRIVEAEAEPTTEPVFADFWLLYPKRVAKLDAEKAWLRMSPADRVDALVGLVTWRAIWIAEDQLQFVPHAATWLRAQRWTDEVPDRWGASHASHVSAKLPEGGERAAMPENVRALLAKLRK